MQQSIATSPLVNLCSSSRPYLQTREAIAHMRTHHAAEEADASETVSEAVVELQTTKV